MIFRLFVMALLLFTVNVAQAREYMRSFPVPDTVSEKLRPYITSHPLASIWNTHPRDKAEWKALVEKVARETMPTLQEFKRKLSVTSEPGSLGGVSLHTLLPREISPEHKDCVLLHIHGGGYVFNPGETGIREGILMAGFGRFKVVSVDYRMPPDHPYPAALDDVLTVYKELLKTYPPSRIGVFGSSTGGGLTLSLILRARQEGLPLPAAIAPGSPWSDLTKTGDSYFTHEGMDNILVFYDGIIKDSALLYANGHDLRDPLLSPVYGDVSGFPPCFLTSGTRDLFLSNTVRMHAKLRRANVPAFLTVHEGMSHITYTLDPDVEEIRWHYGEVSRFFDRYLGKETGR